MKNLKNLFSVLAISVLLIVVAQSCKKNATDDNLTSNDDLEQLDNSTISEEEFEIEEDVLPYEPDALTVTVSGGTKIDDSDADGKCTTVKPSFKKAITINSTSLELGLKFNSNVELISVVNTNTKTGVNGTNAVGQKINFGLIGATLDENFQLDSTKYTVMVSASDTFRLGSAKMTITYKIKSTGNVMVTKTKNVTVYFIGKNSAGKSFGSQAWGFAHEGGNNTRYTGTPVAIDSNYVPAVGDLLTTATGAQRAIITGVTEGVTPTTTSQKSRGLKYTCTYVMWNPRCTGTRKAAKASWYRKVAPTAKVDGTNILSHYVH